MELISSPQNPKIKNLSKLQKFSERNEQGVFMVEGYRELTLAISGNYEIDSIYYCDEIKNKITASEISKLSSLPKTIYKVTQKVFEKIAYRENSDGIIALLKPKNLSLENIILSNNPFIIILEAVEKPGNLGAILRTADAAKVDAVIICDQKTDVYNPNAIRSSVGCVFTNQIAVSSNEKVFDWLKKNNIKAFAAALTATKYYQETDFKKPSAIIMGTEADGLSDFWLINAFEQIKIPMRGKIDSLNVSTSTAILAFEAMRQRGF